MYIFNAFYLLHSYNPSFLICLCFNMVSFRGQKSLATPRSVSFRALIQNFQRASPPLSYTESPPGLPVGGILVFEERGKPEYTEKNLSEQNMALTPGPGCSKLG